MFNKETRLIITVLTILGGLVMAIIGSYHSFILSWNHPNSVIYGAMATDYSLGLLLVSVASYSASWTLANIKNFSWTVFFLIASSSHMWFSLRMDSLLS